MPEIKKRLPDRGLPPLDGPVAGAAIEAMLADEREARSLEHVLNRSAEPARLVASDAQACARKVAFGRLGVPKDITYDAQALMTFRAGDFYHDVAQRAVIQWFNARTEIDFDWRTATPPHPIYGRADGAHDPDNLGLAAIEIKSMAGYGFDLAVGSRRSSEGPGPKIDHLIQGGLGALSPQIGAERVHIIYVNKDKGGVAEWIIGVDDPLPHLTDYDGLFAGDGPTIRELVAAELERLERDVLAVVDAGDLPARSIPGFGIVTGTPPSQSSKGDPWNCRYCSWQPTCAAAGPNDGGVNVGWVRRFEESKSAEPEQVPA